MFCTTRMRIQILFIRGGKLLDHKSDIFPMIDTLEEEVMTYISKFYDKHTVKPNEVIVPELIDKELLKKAFELNFFTPQKGKKAKMLSLACENAKNYYNEQMTLIERNELILEKSLNKLKEHLKLEKIDKI